MLIYEVNLEVNVAIFDEYMAWLKPHIKELLVLEGFLKANILFDKKDEKKHLKKISVAYYINDYQSYLNYIEHQAPQMRKAALERFNGQFRVNSRRVLDIEGSYSA